MASSLSNEDLAPTPPDKRTWKAIHYAALWVGMAVCIPTYTLSSSLIDQGLSAWQAIACVAIGNLVVLIPIVLNAHAGAKYGIPFPVYARSAFGVLGVNIPAMLRALVACGWFGIQTWLGGEALWQLFVAIFPSLEPALASPGFEAVIGINPGELLGFVAFWLINVHFIWKGTESIKFLETWAAPVLIVLGLALLGWAYFAADGFGAILGKPGRLSGGVLLSTMAAGVTAMVSFWGTLALNISDFTRYGRSQKDQMIGQTLGLPPTMILFAFIGVAVTSATEVVYHAPIWSPVDLVRRIGGPLLMVIAMFGVSIATLSTNVAANVVSPANDFSNLAPSRISFRKGGMITAVIGALIFPWRLIESSGGYIYTWLGGYGTLLAPVAAILIVEYFLIRRTTLVVDDLYRRGGAYEYRRGFNPRALAALLLAILPNIPGFIAKSIPSTAPAIPDGFERIYDYAWFVGFLSAGTLYFLLTKLIPAGSVPPARAPATDPA